MRRIYYVILGIWIAAGMILGFAMPPISDDTGAILATRQIAYFHVPMAITMLVGFVLAAWYGIRWLWKRDPNADSISVSFAEVGTYFGVIATVSGAVFAKHNWGMYWSWDPQQVGILITLLTYAALFSLRGAVDDEDKQRSLWAVYAIVGCITAIMMTMVMRRVLPPLSSAHPDNTLVTSDHLNKFALFFNAGAYVMLMVLVVRLRMRLEIVHLKLKEWSWT